MTRPLGKCPVCGRMVTLVNVKYPNVPTTLRLHYPHPYSYYETRKLPFPTEYCPGRKPGKDQR